MPEPNPAALHIGNDHEHPSTPFSRGAGGSPDIGNRYRHPPIYIMKTMRRIVRAAFLGEDPVSVAACPDVMECYLMAGEADYIVRVVAKDAEDYERIHKEHLSRMPGVARIQSSFALRQIVRRNGVKLDGPSA